MAKMIPSVVADGTPMSERNIFERFLRDPDTSDWVVLHSLGLTRTRIGPYGEIDFVVLIPRKGIVCLEVKGGDVTCNDGVWWTRNRKTGNISALNKSPYMQAREGMFAVRAAITEHFGPDHPASRSQFSYAVVFPNVHAPPASTEGEKWETIDVADLREPVSRIVGKNISATTRNRSAKVSADSVSAGTLKEIRQFLRPDFERVVLRSTSVRSSEDQLVALTEEQYDYLDIASANDRALVTGAAGTGKTLLALEFVRREAAAGRSVLFLCYNRVLGNWLFEQVAAEDIPGVSVGTFYAQIRKFIESSSYKSEFDDRCSDADGDEIFGELYPFYAELAIGEQDITFDTLVVDEAQDLAKDSILAVLNMLLQGGLAGGRWALFGDFTRQAIYTKGGDVKGETQVKELLCRYCPHYPVVPLRTNCRNTRQIGEETALLSGFNSLPYRLTHVQGLAVDYRFWKNREDESRQLSKVVGKLLDEKVPPEDIVILSPFQFSKSVVKEAKASIEAPITDIRKIEGKPNGHIIYSTIHAFKGMESPIIIVCDFDDISGEEQRSLLYVAMSRARSHLVLVIGEKTRKLLPDLTKKKLSEQWTS